MTTPRSTDLPTIPPATGKTNGGLARLLARRELELAAAQRMSEVFSQQIKVQDLMAQALRIALDVVDAENGSVLLADPETHTLVFYHSIGDRPVLSGTPIPWDEGIAGTVFRTGQPEIVPVEPEPTQRGSQTHKLIGAISRRWTKQRAPSPTT